jgi:hypothetical protein
MALLFSPDPVVFDNNGKIRNGLEAEGLGLVSAT